MTWTLVACVVLCTAMFAPVAIYSLKLMLYLHQETKNVLASELKVVIFRLSLVALHVVFSIVSYPRFVLAFQWDFWALTAIRLLLFHLILHNVMLRWAELLKRFSRRSPQLMECGMTLNLVMGAVVGLTFVACIIIVMVRKDCSPPWYYCTDYGWQSGAHGESDELNREMVAFGVATFTAFVGFMMMYQFLLYCWLNHAVSEKASSDAGVAGEGENLVVREIRVLQRFLFCSLIAITTQLIWVLFTFSDWLPRSDGKQHMYFVVSMEYFTEFVLIGGLVENLWKKKNVLVGSVSRVPQFTEEDLNHVWAAIIAARSDPTDATDSKHPVRFQARQDRARLSQRRRRPSLVISDDVVETTPAWLQAAFLEMKGIADAQVGSWRKISLEYSNFARFLLGPYWEPINANDLAPLAANMSFLVATANMVGGSGSYTGLFAEDAVREWYETQVSHNEPLLLGQNRFAHVKVPWEVVFTVIQEMNAVLGQRIDIPAGSISILALAQLFCYEEFNNLLVKDSVVCHDMTQPLAHYWISCSHNTCCMEDQYATDCQPSVFEWCLLQGCRCIELDLWDGADSEPVVCHGPTTGRCSLDDTLNAIMETAFLKSPYPLIISLDNNCSEVVQVRVAEILEDVLGDLIVLPGSMGKPIEQCSPEELRGRIIIRGKKPDVSKAEVAGFRQSLREERSRNTSGSHRALSIRKSRRLQEDEDSVTLDVAPHAAIELQDVQGGNGNEGTTKEATTENHTPETKLGSSTTSTESLASSGLSSPAIPMGTSAPGIITAVDTADQGDIGGQEPHREGGSRSHAGSDADMDTRPKRSNSMQNIAFEKKVPPPPQLQELTTMIALRLAASPSKCNKSNSYTIAEGKLNGLLEAADPEEAKKWHHIFNAYMVRTFPPPIYVYSENYDPQRLWATGAHAVALNFQHIDQYMVLQRSWFERNGSAGYVLKPSCLRDLDGGRPHLELTQPERYLCDMPSSSRGDVLQRTAEAVQHSPCVILKVDVKFAYSCHIPEAGIAKQYYAINSETKRLKEVLRQQGEEGSMHPAAMTLKTSRRTLGRESSKEAIFEGGKSKSNMGTLRVQMETRGVKPDQKKVSTRACLNLQGYGAWQETFQFPFLSIHTAECSQLYVEIVHDTAGVIANQAFPLAMLRRGSGELRLLDPSRLGDAPTAACLVCKIEMEEAILTQEEFRKAKRRQSTEDQISNESFGL